MKKVFKKADVKAGMLLKTANGDCYTVIPCFVTVHDEVGLALVEGAKHSARYFPLDNYNDDLLYTNDLGIEVRNSDYDAVEVWGHTYPMHAMDNDTRNRKLLWKRCEPDGKNWDEMSDQEKDIECDKYDSCEDCPHEKGCDGDIEDNNRFHYYLNLLKDVREVVADLNNDGIRHMFENMTKHGLIPQHESDYILGKRDDIDISAVKADGKWKLCADENEPDDRDEDEGDWMVCADYCDEDKKEAFLAFVKSLFE